MIRKTTRLDSMQLKHLLYVRTGLDTVIKCMVAITAKRETVAVTLRVTQVCLFTAVKKTDSALFA